MCLTSWRCATRAQLSQRMRHKRNRFRHIHSSLARGFFLTMQSGAILPKKIALGTSVPSAFYQDNPYTYHIYHRLTLMDTKSEKKSYTAIDMVEKGLCFLIYITLWFSFPISRNYCHLFYSVMESFPHVILFNVFLIFLRFLIDISMIFMSNSKRFLPADQWCPLEQETYLHNTIPQLFYSWSDFPMSFYLCILIWKWRFPHVIFMCF